ncbi:MAG: hypothetical protein HYY04_16895 [Chloroflexi bacterium]|nr:hypothetical protein [Chloroflexota bacterium]
MRPGDSVDLQTVAYIQAQVTQVRERAEALAQQVKTISGQIERLEYVVRQAAEESTSRAQMADLRISQLRHQMQFAIGALALGGLIAIGAVAATALSR